MLPYLKAPLEGDLTREIADEIYLREYSPLEKMINTIVGTPDAGRLTMIDRDDHQKYQVYYTANNGNTMIELEYTKFGFTDDCNVSMNIIYSKLADIAKGIIKTAVLDNRLRARGGLDIKMQEGTVQQITYWTQNTVETEGSKDARTTDVAEAYAFLREKCFTESVRMKANADQYVRNLVMDGILDTVEIKTNN